MNVASSQDINVTSQIDARLSSDAQESSDDEEDEKADDREFLEQAVNASWLFWVIIFFLSVEMIQALTVFLYKFDPADCLQNS